MKVLPVHASNAVFGENESLYQCVLDDFKSAKFIGILTYNISSRLDSHLLKSLKDACLRGTNAVIITNIPKNQIKHSFSNKIIGCYRFYS